MRRFGRGLDIASVLASLVAPVLAVAGVAAPARAADMSVPPAAYPPPAYYPPALYDWTGLYFGGNAGGAILNDRVSQSAAAAAATNLAGSFTVSPAGFAGGGQIGVNYEFAPWVIGAEVSLDETTISGSSVVQTIPIAAATEERLTDAPLWYATVTGRVGYAANDWLFYAKGGAAMMHDGYIQETLVNGAVNSASQTFSVNRTGFTAGFGVEYALTENFTARLEYDFIDTGSKTYLFNLTPLAITSYLNTLTLGINYRFNWAGGGPIAGR
jgi:outer membrane immunogenic protein